MAALDTDSIRPRLVVANRLPVAWSPAGGWERAPGGLVTALEAHARRRRTTWVGAASTLGDSAATPPAWPHGRLVAVPIAPQLASSAVDGMANSCLWPALHGMADRMQWRDDWWEGYGLHNERFAATIGDQAPEGAMVWVHDHHLLLVPQLLAAARPDLVVGLSIHTPFSATVLAQLPVADELATALAAPGVLGLQTADDRERLGEFCPQRVGDTIVSPASIDPDELTALGREPATRTLVERLRGQVGDRRLIVGIDRIDHTKALLQRLDAIDRAFRSGTIRPDDVEIIQIAQPSRSALASFRELRVEIERRGHAVASHWQRSDGTPAVRVVVEGRDRRQVVALLAAADLALVTPLRDGMNLVAKEFSICNEDRAGVLVLSSGAGAADALGDASVLVDGSDASSVADGIDRAVRLDLATRREMARRRAEAVRSWTAVHWAAAFERQLLAVGVSADHRAG